MATLYDPVRDEIVRAEKGKGAFLNDMPISISQKHNLQKTVSNWSEPEYLPSLQQLLLEKGTKPMSLYSAQYSGLKVATGDMAASIYAGKKLWDIAAVDLIVREAGGMVTDLQGEPIDYLHTTRGAVASCGGDVHNELLQAIGEAQRKDKGLKTTRWLQRTVEAKRLKQKFWETIVEGRFAPEEIDVTSTEPGASVKRTARSESFIEEEWKRRITAGLKPWPNDLKPSRFRFVDANVVDGRLKITIDPGVSYHDTIGSRPAEFEKKFGAEFMPNPVAVTTVIRAKNKSGEEMFLMTIRDKKHDIKPGGYHISFGGAMDIGKDKTPTDTAMREVTEEASIKPEELEGLTCLGVIKHVIGSSTEIIYEARISIPVEEILERSNDGENKVIAIPATASRLREWIVVPTHANVGVTNVSVLWVGKEIIRREEGDEAAARWVEMVGKMLAVRSEQARKKGTEALAVRDTSRLKIKVNEINKRA